MRKKPKSDTEELMSDAWDATVYAARFAKRNWRLIMTAAFAVVLIIIIIKNFRAIGAFTVLVLLIVLVNWSWLMEQDFIRREQ